MAIEKYESLDRITLPFISYSWTILVESEGGLNATLRVLSASLAKASSGISENDLHEKVFAAR